MNIKYNYKEMEDIELYITKSKDDDTITLKIAFTDDNDMAKENYGENFECDGHCETCVACEYCEGFTCTGDCENCRIRESCTEVFDEEEDDDKPF